MTVMMQNQTIKYVFCCDMKAAPTRAILVDKARADDND